MTAAAASGAGRRQATGRVMARTAADAAAPPCGWLVWITPLTRATA